MSKMKSWNDEPAIQQKEYSQEKYNKKKERSLRLEQYVVSYSVFNCSIYVCY